MSKIVLTFVTMILLSAVFVMPVSAHHGNSHRQKTVCYTACTGEEGIREACIREECTNCEIHTHGNTTYDGHMPYCEQEDCTEAGIHEHDGISYCIHSQEKQQGHHHGRHH